MRSQIIISTKKYHEKIAVLLKNQNIICGKVYEEYFFSLPYHNFKDIIPYEQLEDVLENIVLDNNAIVKNCENALIFMKKNVFKPHRKALIYDVALTLECKRCLNIDGYIDFKMQKFAAEIDRVLYCTVKRSNTKED